MSEYRNVIVLTGAPGSGKSSLLAELAQFNISVIPEPARQILAEQRSIKGPGVPEIDPALFIRLMLSRTMGKIRELDRNKVYVFDRSIPDLIAYATHLKVSLPELEQAKEIRFNSNVYYLPSWREIYRNDEERTMTFEAAARFGRDMLNVYTELGYNVIQLPTDETPIRRARRLLIEEQVLLRGRAKVEDMEALFSLHSACMREIVEQQFGVWDIKWQRDNFFKAPLRSEDTEILLEPVSRRIVAAWKIFPTNVSARSMFLSNIEIHPDYQGLGLGSQIIKRAIAGESTRELTLQVLHGNSRAYAFYNRLGFRETSKTDTHIVMKKDCEPNDD